MMQDITELAGSSRMLYLIAVLARRLRLADLTRPTRLAHVLQMPSWQSYCARGAGGGEGGRKRRGAAGNFWAGGRRRRSRGALIGMPHARARPSRWPARSPSFSALRADRDRFLALESRILLLEYAASLANAF